MIQPHGDELVGRCLRPEAKPDATQIEQLPRLVISPSRAADVANIAHGVYSPCEGFIGADDLAAVLATSRLTSGVPWTIPILCDVPDPATYSEGTTVALYSAERPEALALLHVEEVYRWDKQRAAQAVFGTTDGKHPGVARVLGRGDYLLAGPVDLLADERGPFAQLALTPAETRTLFAQRGWQTVCAFQTRNVPHAGHEDLQKTVLGLVDGLLIQPVIGAKKPADFTDAAIVAAYQALTENYFPPDRVVLSPLPTDMHYAGPNEAIHHAIMRKNFGCTHIIIGRDHAGVGNYYGEEEAIERFSDFPDLGIQPIVIRGDFWFCRRCNRVASDRTCPHPVEDRIEFSGTRIRETIQAGDAPPEQVMRPEVFAALREVGQVFVR
jgi:sulfate adenylyltransferase